MVVEMVDLNNLLTYMHLQKGITNQSLQDISDGTRIATKGEQARWNELVITSRMMIALMLPKHEELKISDSSSNEGNEAQ